MKKEVELYDLITKVINEQADQELEFHVFTRLNKLGYHIVSSVINEKFTNMPLEFDEMYSYIYYVYVDTVKWCRLHHYSAKHLVNLFFRKLQFCTINTCRQYVAKGHAILNCVYNTDFFNENEYALLAFKNSDIWNDVINSITDEQRCVLLLKLKGYNSDEIAKIMHRKTPAVRRQMKLIQENPEIRKLFNKDY